MTIKMFWLVYDKHWYQMVFHMKMLYFNKQLDKQEIPKWEIHDVKWDFMCKTEISSKLIMLDC